tara:strand:+ start:671 stop:1015 length:345 start_codon:yes stop_codon:yes gene_type:complete
MFPTASIAYEQNPTLWVQVPQWENDWSECAVDIPDASCHWYVASPDNTFGEGFSWDNSPWFDANGLNDIPTTSKKQLYKSYNQLNKNNSIIYFKFNLISTLIFGVTPSLLIQPT